MTDTHENSPGDPMNDAFVLFAADDNSTITLNQPENANTPRFNTVDGPERSLERANAPTTQEGIVLDGAGNNVRAGFDFSRGLEHRDDITAADDDPGLVVELLDRLIHCEMARPITEARAARAQTSKTQQEQR